MAPVAGVHHRQVAHALADATPLPLIVYSFPTKSARPLSTADVLIELGVFPGTKAILKLQGLDCGPCRKPFGELTGEPVEGDGGCAGNVIEEAVGQYAIPPDPLQPNPY